MVQAGILREDERIELLDGVLVAMSPQGPQHASRVAILAERLSVQFADGHCVRQEKPLVIGGASLPEPDIAVVRGSHADYEREHPHASDCVLVVELAVTSLETDRDKAKLYARGHIPAYVLIDLRHRRLVLHEDPRAGGYARVTEFDADASFALPGTDQVWTVASMLPDQV